MVLAVCARDCSSITIARTSAFPRGRMRLGGKFHPSVHILHSQLLLLLLEQNKDHAFVLVVGEQPHCARFVLGKGIQQGKFRILFGEDDDANDINIFSLHTQKDLQRRLRQVLQVLREDETIQVDDTAEWPGLASTCDILSTFVVHEERNIRLLALQNCMELFAIVSY